MRDRGRRSPNPPTPKGNSMTGALHASLRDYAIQHHWKVVWDHQFPNGTHLGLQNGVRQISLTFHGDDQLRSPVHRHDAWHHLPQYAGSIDHCGYWHRKGPRNFIATNSLASCRQLIRRGKP